MPSVKELVEKRFGGLTGIQKLAMPKVLAGENVLILAPTGNGKTEAALLPILEKLQNRESGICALYITPLRALNRDLLKRFNWWCDRLQISHDVRHGDTTQAQRAKHRKDPPKIMLTTVETLQALLLGSVMRRHLANVEFVIVDEVHDILDNKRGAQLSMGLERLREIADFQRIAISATVANEKEAAKLVFGEREYSIAEAGRNRKMELSVESVSSLEKRAEKMKKLVEGNRTLLFVNTRSGAEELGAKLKAAKAPIEVHHGSLAKEMRVGAEDSFKSGALQSILSTSSLELGIDIGDVELVVQNGSPHQVFRMVQRVGRSGHSLSGVPKGVIFPADFDDSLEAEAIVIRARNGWIEDKLVERRALDVIAHQVVGVLLDKGRMRLADIHKILSRSYAYGIDYEKLRKIALQLHAERLVFYDEHGRDIFLKAARRGREYYYTNLSTIPKQKRFLMRDVSSNRIIASLDEEFVMNLENGAGFLSRGMPWQVVDITDKEVLAEPSGASDIAIPEWTGEDIPVPFEIAQDVGKLRRASRKKANPLPDERTVVVEMFSDVIVVHASFGSKVNEGIARMLSANLSNMIGESVRAVADPYRIIVKLPFPLKEGHVKAAFEKMGSVRSSLLKSLERSFLLRFKFQHVARLFGMLEEDANVGSRFIEMMRYSVVYEEAVRAIFFRYFDVERTEEMLNGIKSGKIALVYDSRKKPSFFAGVGIDRISAKEAVGGFEPREAMIDAFRERVLTKTAHLRCLNCGVTRYMHLAGAPDIIRCHKCNEQSLAVAPKEGRGEGLEFSAGIIRAFGKRGLVALSTYGIGPATADRVLRKLQKEDRDFYWDLLQAQKNFVKNKRFWKP